MRTKLTLLALLWALTAHAQQNQGVQFVEGLRWAQVQQQAREQNKFIFVDVYTTWCGPCKQMDRDVFPDAAAGTFFNTYFLSVKIQADSTKHDSKAVRQMYLDAKALVAAYTIDSYPTYLFFSPEGELVHRIQGASPTAQAFISKAELALSGYHKQKLQFTRGNRDPAHLRELVKAAQLLNDRELLPVVANAYLTTQQNLLTEEHLQLIAQATTRTTDPGFTVLLQHTTQADAVLGPGRSRQIITNIVFDEILLPQLRINGAKKDYGGGMVSYSGEVNEQVDWGKIEAQLQQAYPAISQEVLLMAKPQYYRWRNNWPAYTHFVSANAAQFSPADLNSHANYTFLFAEDAESLKTALTWMKNLLKEQKTATPHYQYTYATLLYKTGAAKQAITTMEEVIAQAGPGAEHLQEQLQKMKAGKKIW